MVDRLRPDALPRRDDRRERDQLAARRLHVEHRERRRILLVLRRHLHDDLILVVGREDLRDLPRAVGRRERRFHLIDGQPERRDLLAIEIHLELGVLDLQVRVDVEQSGQIAQRRLEARRDTIELLGVGILQRELVLRPRLMPPMRIAGGFVRTTRTPGTRANFGRSSSMT